MPARVGLVVGVALVLAALATAQGPARSPGVLDEAERDRFLADLEQALASVETVSVRFRQERHLSLFTEPMVSSGVLAFARPDRLHWEWVTPYGGLLVLNRGEIARFDVDNGTPRRLRSAGEDVLRSVAEQMTRWLQGRFRDSSQVFDLEVLQGHPPTIVLRPRSHGLAAALDRIEVELGHGPTVARVTLHSPGGDRTVVGFFDEHRNLSLADELFSVDRPALAGSDDRPGP